MADLQISRLSPLYFPDLGDHGTLSSIADCTGCCDPEYMQTFVEGDTLTFQVEYIGSSPTAQPLLYFNSTGYLGNRVGFTNYYWFSLLLDSSMLNPIVGEAGPFRAEIGVFDSSVFTSEGFSVPIRVAAADEACVSLLRKVTYSGPSCELGVDYAEAPAEHCLRVEACVRNADPDVTVNAFRTPSGTFKRCSSFINRQKTILTGYLPDWLIETLNHASLSTSFTIDDLNLQNVNGSFFQRGLQHPQCPLWQTDVTFNIAENNSSAIACCSS